MCTTSIPMCNLCLFPFTDLIFLFLILFDSQKDEGLDKQPIGVDGEQVGLHLCLHDDLCVGQDPGVGLTDDGHGGVNAVQLQAEEKTGDQGIGEDGEVPRNNDDDTEPEFQVAGQEVGRDISNEVIRAAEVKAIIKKRIMSPVLLNIKL